MIIILIIIDGLTKSVCVTGEPSVNKAHGNIKNGSFYFTLFYFEHIKFIKEFCI